MVLRRSASRMDMVIVAVVVTIAALRIQELDKGNDATFLIWSLPSRRVGQGQ